MSGFEGMEDLLQDFLVEAGELLAGVDNKLVDLEQSPGDHRLLNEIFRGFHTIKGGAGFLNATELVTLCHLTENLFDKLRNNQMTLTPEIMDVIMSATAGVRTMFDTLEGGMQPGAADPAVIAALKQVLTGESAVAKPATPVPAPAPTPLPAAGPDWNAMFQAVTGPATVTAPAAPAAAAAASGALPVSHDVTGAKPEQVIAAAIGRRATDKPGAPAPAGRREKRKGARQLDSRGHLAPRPGAESLRRNRFDQEPPQCPSLRHSQRPYRYGNPARA